MSLFLISCHVRQAECIVQTPDVILYCLMYAFPGICVEGELSPFDSEIDAALYVLDEFRNGAIVSAHDVEIAKAIIRGDKPMFVYEEKQPDGTLLLSLHDSAPPEGSKSVAFGSRSAPLLARFLLRRLHESKRVRASEETIRQAQALMDEG